MRLLLPLAVAALLIGGCGEDRNASEKALTDLPGVRDARVRSEEVDDGQTDVTATVDMETDASEREIAGALDRLGRVDALFRDLTVDAGTVERPDGVDQGPGVYRVDPDGGGPSPSAQARWLVTAMTLFPDGRVRVGLNDRLEVELGPVGPAGVADAADRFRADPRLRDVVLSVRGKPDPAGPSASLIAEAGFGAAPARELRRLSRTARRSVAPVLSLSVTEFDRASLELRTVVALGDDTDPDSISAERYVDQVGAMLRAQLDLVRQAPAGSQLVLEAGRSIPTKLLHVTARPRPSGEETYGGPGWNDVALAYLRSRR